ncbi:MAG: CapA family protein, partial [Clostridia bacterium]|nr:CapA family protein [Clostridia bacterium]
QQAARKKRGLASLPEWARLGFVALALVALIGVVGHIITTSGTQQDRTVIRPLVSSTETPEPDVEVQQVVSNNVDPDSAPANPGGATAAPTPEPSDWSGAVTTGQPVSIPEGDLRRATIRMAGDVIVDWEMLQGCYDKATDRYDFSPYFELIGTTLSSSDYTMINIEASLRKGKYGYSGYPQFTTPPAILQLLRNVGVDMITMCNNHMLDGYCDGIVESVSYVNDARLDHIGGYVDQEDSETPEIYEINGIRVGFVTYTQVTNDMEYKSDDRYKYLVHYFKNAKFKDDIAKTRAAGAEVVVAVAHWGEEYKRSPESSTVSYAKQLAAAGADVIIGGHPHMVQPAEYITATDSSGNSHTALCIYSLGNFLSQHVAKYTDSGVVFEFTIQENTNGSFSIVEAGYVPVFVWKWPATDANGKTIMGTTKGRDDKPVYNLRLLPIARYMDNPPEGMSDEQYARMRECWFETLEVMNNSSVIQVLSE